MAVDYVRDAELGLSVFEQSPDAILVVDTGGQICLVNAQAELLFGYPRSALRGNLVEMLIPERIRGHHVGYREHFAMAARIRPMGLGLQLAALHKSGVEIAVEINLAPVVVASGQYTIVTIRRVDRGANIPTSPSPATT